MSSNDNDPDAKLPPPQSPVVEAVKPKRAHRKKPEGRGFRPFQKGEGGRRKGIPNRTTRVLKELIIIAADVTGSDGKGKDGAVGYLSWLARREPAVFGNLLGKVLPLQLQMTPPGDGDDTNKDRYTASELREQLIARGLRVPTLIDVTPQPKETPAEEAEEQEVEEDESAG